MTISNYVQIKVGELLPTNSCSSVKTQLERDVLFNLCEEMYALISMSKYKVPEESDQKSFLEIVAKIETTK